MNFDYGNAAVNVVIADVKEILNDQQKFLKTLYQNMVTTSTVDMSKFKWNGIETTQNDVSKLLNETWDASLRAINSGVNESVVIDRRGITLSDSTDPLKGIRMTHGVIGLSSDGFNSLGVALDGSGVYAEKLIGKIIAGEKLLIENESLSFSVDKDSVTIKDADLTITRSDGKTRILASPNDGFKVQKLQNSTWTDKLYASFDGDLTVEDLITKRIIIKDGEDTVLFDAANKTIDFSNFTSVIMGGDIIWNVKPSYDYSEIGGTPSIPTIPSYITQTKISFDSIESPNILGGTMAVGQAAIGQAGSIFKITNQGIQLGHDTFASSPFHVDMLGNMFASSATLTDPEIKVGSGDSVFKVSSLGIQLGNEDWDLAPFRVDRDGNVVANNIGMKTQPTGARIELVPHTGYADLKVYNNANQNVFQIYDEMDGTCQIYNPSGAIHFGHASLGSVYAYGTWNFNGANVTGLVSEAVFG
jgi:hypothetical protein